MPTKKFKKIGPLYRGLLFDGTNAAEVAAYFRDRGFTARSGGNWVRIQTPYGETLHVIVSRNTYALIEEFTNAVKVVAEDVFEEQFKLSGKRSKEKSWVKKETNVEAIQLDGNNAKEVADFARSKGRVARGGNGWVKFSDKTATVSDWVIWYPDASGLGVMSVEVFEHTYAPTR